MTTASTAKTPKMLFDILGIKLYTARHYKTVQDFLDKPSGDAKILLNQLGQWNEEDLRKTVEFLNS